MSTGRHEATRVKTNNRAYGQAERRADFVDELAVRKPGRRALAGVNEEVSDNA